MNSERLDKKIIAIFIFFALIFFLSEHNLHYSLLANYDLSSDVFENAALEGNLQRQAAFMALAVFAIIGLVARVRHRLEIHGALGGILTFFALWSVTSISWSIDPELTFRRLGVFIIICLAAVAMARLYPINFLPACAFFVTTTYLLAGLIVEICLGTFRPLSEGYRFAGTLHPNIQGTNCAIMFLAAMSLAESSARWRKALFIFACVAFVALMLTKSRTSFAAALFVLVVFKGLRAPLSKYLKVVFSMVWVFCLSYLLWGEESIAAIHKWLFMGRESEGLETFTGRIQIWDKSLLYIAQRPFQGYGFNSFWVPRHIREFSDAIGIGINGAHSVYLGLLLDVGLVGLMTYIFILCKGIMSSRKCYIRTGAAGFGFLFMLLVFSAMHGLFEGEVIAMSFDTFLMIFGFVHLASLKPADQLKA